MSSGPEQRIHPRIPLQLLVQFRLKDIDTFLREHAVNISSGGLFISSSTPHPNGTMIYLQIQLDNGQKLIEGLGRVVHVNLPSQDNPGMGIEFVNIDEKSQQLINDIVEKRLAKNS